MRVIGARNLLRFYVVALVCACIPGAPGQAAHAQERDSPIQLGVTLGYSQASFGGGNEVNQSRPGVVFGGFARFRALSFLSAEAELLLTRKGAGATLDVQGIPLDLTLELAYIEVPILLQIRPLGEGGRLRPYVVAGVAPAFEVGCEVRAQAGDVVGGTGCSSGSEDLPVRNVDFGGIAGLGVELRVSDSWFRLEGRIERGLVTVFQDGSDLYNQQWAVLVGFTF